MPALTWLPAVLRAAGLTVHEAAGWRTRTSSQYRVDQIDARAVVCHATAGSRSASDADEIRVLLNGSRTAPAPIAHLYLGRQGHWWVVAAGVCNHIGDADATPEPGYRGNRHAIGIEAANDNRTEPWPPVQYDSYVRGVAAICAHRGWGPDRVVGHKEISSSGKTDPTFGMGTFRARVAGALREDDMSAITEDRWKWMAGVLHGTFHMLHSGVPNAWITTTLAAVLQAAREDLDADQILTGIRQELQAHRTELLHELAPQLVAALRDQLAEVPPEQWTTASETAVRRVLGSLDNTPP